MDKALKEVEVILKNRQLREKTAMIEEKGK
jgi:hypothetical protein